MSFEHSPARQSRDGTVDRIVRPNEAAKILGIHPVHLKRLEDQGLIPKRFQIVPSSGKYGAKGLMLSWITDFIKMRIEASREAGGEAA